MHLRNRLKNRKSHMPRQIWTNLRLVFKMIEAPISINMLRKYAWIVESVQFCNLETNPDYDPSPPQGAPLPPKDANIDLAPFLF
jgi:hypothetical protein